MIRKTAHGFSIIDGDTHISKWAEETGRLDHDQYILPQILKYIPENGTIFDGGCYIGDHTIAYANKVGPRGHVIGLDANEEALLCCMENVGHLKNCTLLNNYLSNKSNDCAFLLKDDKNHGSSRMALSESDSVESIEGAINSIAIDHVIFNVVKAQRLDFLKLDVEGCEIFALEGAIKSIVRFRPVIFLEINKAALARHGFDHATVRAALEQFGYTSKNIPDCDNDSEQYDILALPKEKTYSENQ